ncbi:hypothetical protein [Bacillus thuringiensis]|uniref:hypothetical protein n=1 Tax=Bacillus thuringiensis TaxID=1428 RepID=UPI000BF90E69|nr:hypothetical protein [Bacillus thuringiensis]PEY73213.1 hypothetical protein CN355_11265 [Bacillus thuringiensis]
MNIQDIRNLMTDEKDMESDLSEIATSSFSNFHYSSLNYIEVIFLVNPEKVFHYFDGTGLKPVLFGGKSFVSFNFQRYTSDFSSEALITQEVELSIASIPEAQEKFISIPSFKEYLHGKEQAQSIGNYRIHVPCDDVAAIEAGIKKFGEPKFQAIFNSKIPTLNEPAIKSWKFTCKDSTPQEKEIFSCEVDLYNFEAEKVHLFSQVYYGHKNNKLIESCWSHLQPVFTYAMSSDNTSRVKLSIGTSEHAMQKDMQNLLRNEPVKAVRVFQSQPVAIQGSPYLIKY